MISPPKARSPFLPLIAPAVVLAAVLAIWCFGGRSGKLAVAPEIVRPPAVTANERPGTLSRPLPVARETQDHQWTEGDGLTLETIRQIAHNPDEFIKMVEENDRIHRRQLVYRRDTAAAVVQRARLSGELVRRLTLPGLDGRELEVEIDRADLSPSGQSGNFTGHLAGRPGSSVTLAFQFGTEAFTVLSPEDNLFLQADPREPGEIIVKSIDPATYAPGRCGNPDTVAGK